MLIRPRLQLRLARAADAAEIAAIAAREVEDGLPGRVWHRRRILASMDDEDIVALVAQIDGRLIGFAIMKFGTLSAHLHLMAVLPEHRRSGIGRQLLGWLTQSARTAGITRIRLEVREGNAPARAFYAALGYEVRERVPGYYGGREAALRLVRRLAPETTARD